MANLTPTGSSGKSAVPSLNHTGLSRGLKDREHTRSFSTRLFRKHTRSLSTRSSGNTPDHLVLDCQGIYLIAQCSSSKGKIALLGSLLLLLQLVYSQNISRPVQYQNVSCLNLYPFFHLHLLTTGIGESTSHAGITQRSNCTRLPYQFLRYL